MKSLHRPTVFLIVVIAGLLIPNVAHAQKAKSPLKAPESWTGETITLPPGFARDMKLKGTEHVRFAPGMFKAKSDSFFSYVFAFELEKGTKIDQAILQRELLAYYRGLSKVVLQDKAKDVDFKTFTLELKPAKARPVKTPSTFIGKLNWVEPFATKSKQTLHLELQTWSHKDHEIVFVCVSPKASVDTKKKTPEIWQQMRKIRKDYFAKNVATEPAAKTKDQTKK